MVLTFEQASIAAPHGGAPFQNTVNRICTSTLKSNLLKSMTIPRPELMKYPQLSKCYLLPEQSIKSPRNRRMPKEGTSLIHKELSKLLYTEKESYEMEVSTSEQSQFQSR